jgi:hypothetical protein
VVTAKKKGATVVMEHGDAATPLTLLSKNWHPCAPERKGAVDTCVVPKCWVCATFHGFLMKKGKNDRGRLMSKVCSKYWDRLPMIRQTYPNGRRGRNVLYVQLSMYNVLIICPEQLAMPPNRPICQRPLHPPM